MSASATRNAVGKIVLRKLRSFNVQVKAIRAVVEVFVVLLEGAVAMPA